MAGIEHLIIWQRAMALVPRIYRVTRHLPSDEDRVLKPQIRRAAISVPSNIAEGHARRGSREFARFLSTAQGSVAELMTQLLLAVNLGYVSKRRLAPVIAELEELAKMLNASRRKLLGLNP